MYNGIVFASTALHEPINYTSIAMHCTVTSYLDRQICLDVWCIFPVDSL